MDAIIGLEGNGPGTGGIPKKTGLILVSEDSCALDIVASEMIGFDPLEVYTNRYCIERSLTDPKKIEIIGGKRKIPYKRPINAPSFASPIIGFVMKHAAMKPYAIRKKCKRCAVCKEICPVKAIALKPYPVIDKKRCISCYCCHENCPYNAMDLRGSRIIELLQKIKNKVMKSDNDKGK
jgi:ferredoxin